MTLDAMVNAEVRELMAIFAYLENEMIRVRAARDGAFLEDFKAGELGGRLAELANKYETQRAIVRALVAARNATKHTTEGEQ